MAKIPTITSQVSARAGGPSGQLANAKSTPDDFGAAIGRATQQLGGTLGQVANQAESYFENKRKETVANKVALSDFTPREIEIRNATPADGSGYRDSVVTEYRNYVEEQAEGIDDPLARKEYKNRMLRQAPEVSRRSAVYEATISATNSKEQANASISSLNNKIRTDPTLYTDYVQQGEDVIDARSDLTPTVKAGMKAAWRRDSARTRFQGMLAKAQTVEDLDNVAKELTDGGKTGSEGEPGKDWAKEFSPQDYERTLNDIGTARKAMLTKADTDARAALGTIEDRAKDVNVLLPQDELAVVQQTVKKSQNPITIARMARVMRDQEVIRESRTATPAELRSRINGANGSPAVSYPGLPPVLSGAVNKASKRFGVSASYLGGTIQREYGGNLKRKAADVDAKFKPSAIHKGVDLRNVRPDVLEAATVAGQIFGGPLPVTSGRRSQGHQNRIRAKGDPNRASVAKKSHHTSGTALDISTAGMSAEEKGRLVGALVDAGFTGIGEYGTHIHGDFRNAVPNSFGERDGKFWGGWTHLSPEVVKALTDRGYGSGVSSKAIKRSAPVTYSDDIDFGRGTDLKKADGTPASSAVGVMQFTNGTFLDVVKAPGMAARIGIDIEGKTDAQLLEMRKDPEIATMAGAALASMNKKTLEGSLGRSVSDPEMYMAHFLGAGGATALISGMEKQDQQSAAKLLPEVAKTHKNVFYNKDGSERTVREVYSRMVSSFSTNPSQVAHGDNETRQRVLKQTKTALKNDPMAHARDTGTFNVTPLSVESGFALRGQEMQSVTDYYSIPVSDMKPFTEDEASSLSKAMKEGSADDVLEIVTAIQGMGSKAASAALKQLGEKDSVVAYAAGLQFSKGQGSVASDIIRGQKRIDENPDIKSQVGAEKSDLNDSFMQATGGALLGAEPKQRQAIQDAALAYYIETVTARGGAGAFDAEAYKVSVQSVLGGKQGTPAIAEVNGSATVLPDGVTSDVMETALDKMSVDDWIQMSDNDSPPRYVTGDVIAPDDLADEGKFQAIGGNKYRILLDDGSYAVTDRLSQNGRLEAYVFDADADTLNEIAARPEQEPTTLTSTGKPIREEPVDGDGILSTEEQANLRKHYGVLYNYDESGKWLGPSDY